MTTEEKSDIISKLLSKGFEVSEKKRKKLKKVLKKLLTNSNSCGIISKSSARTAVKEA